MSEPQDYTEFVIARSDRLLRLAYLMTQDWAKAEDLLQAALIKAWRVWGRIDGNREAYVKKIITTTYFSWWRRRWRDETPTDVLPDRADQRNAVADADRRDVLWRAIGRLPKRQRAVLVLRYFEDLTEAEIAECMGCSAGTVKSQAAKAMAKLRADSDLVPALVLEV